MIMTLTTLALAAQDFRIFNIVPPAENGDEIANAAAQKEYCRATGNRDLLYIIYLYPGVVTTPLEEQIQNFRTFRAALAGENVRVGVLAQSTLGHRAPNIQADFQRAISVSGAQIRYCILDPRFQAWLADGFAKIAAEKPSMIMIDDDVRNMSPEIECFCPLHIAELNRRLKSDYTAAQVQEAIKNGKPGDKLYDEFFRLAEEIPLKLTTMLREAVEKTAPEIELAACLPGRGTGSRAAFAALMKDRPGVLRITNQMYCEESPRTYFGGVVMRTMGQALFARQFETLLDESDSYPHSLYSRSAVGFNAKLATGIFCGLRGAKVWLVNCRKFGETGPTQYLDILAKYRDFYPALAREVAKSRPAGVFIPCFARAKNLHLVNYPNEQHYPMSSWASTQFGMYGIPFFGTLDYTQDGIYALGGKESVERLNDEELNEIFRHRVLVDGIAAKALTRRGFAPLLGCTVVDDQPIPGSKEMATDGSQIFASPASSASLTDCAKQAQALTVYAVPGGKEPTTIPAAIYFENRLGGKVVTTAFEIEAWMVTRLTESRQRAVNYYLDQLAGGKFDFVLDNRQSELLLQRKTSDGADLLLAVNTGYDPIAGVKIRCAKTPTAVEELTLDGNWQKLDFQFADGTLTLPRTLHCYDILAIKVRYAKNGRFR